MQIYIKNKNILLYQMEKKMSNLNPKSKPATIREIKDNAPYSNYQLYSYILSSLSIFITGLEFTLYSNL